MSHAQDLKQTIRGEVDDSIQARTLASHDASIFSIMPEVVLYPENVGDVEKIVSYVGEKKKNGEHVSVTARSAGTDMSGGPLNDSIIVDFTKHFNHLKELGDDYAVVEPGMYYRDFDKETLKKNLILPCYTASREINTVGGMVGNNSGGEKNLKYGKTARYVKELEIVFADGKAHTIKPLSPDELEAKCKEENFEGEIYKKIKALIDNNKDVIEKNKPTVSKNSSGYALWDVIDKDGNFDLTKIITGSQGTLGLVTKIKFSLVKPKPHSAMVVIFLKDLTELGHITNAVLAHGPESFESYDDHTFALAVKYFPEFAAQMKAGIISLGFQFLPEVMMVLMGGVPKLVLLAEFTGDTSEEALKQAQVMAKEITEKFHVPIKLAKNEQEARKYWVIRRESFNLLRKKVRKLKSAPFIDDFVVSPNYLPEFLPKLYAILEKYKHITYTVAGHVGDGNFHIIPLMDFNRPDLEQTIDTLSHEVYDLVVSYKGSITGEHNDGLIRTPYIEKMFGKEMTNLFSEIKNIFDPLSIFNPGKKTGTTFEGAMRQLDRSQKK